MAAAQMGGVKRGSTGRGPLSAKKRAVHNASEKRRAQRINENIDSLRELLTESGRVFKKDKGSVLEQALLYITELRAVGAPGVDYRSVFLYGSVPTAVAGMDGTFLDANNTFCTLTGYPREEVLSKSFFNLTPPQELQATFSIVSELMGHSGTCASRSFKKLCRMRYGTVQVFVSMSLVKGDDDALPAYFTCAVLPMTAEEQADPAALAALAGGDAASSRSSGSGGGAGGPASVGRSCSDPPTAEPPAAAPQDVVSGAPVAACAPGDGACADVLSSFLGARAAPQAPPAAAPAQDTLRGFSLGSVATADVLPGGAAGAAAAPVGRVPGFPPPGAEAGLQPPLPPSALPHGLPLAPHSVFAPLPAHSSGPGASGAGDVGDAGALWAGLGLASLGGTDSLLEGQPGLPGTL